MVVDVADDAHGGAAIGVEVALFARRHAQDRAAGFEAEELGEAAGGAGELTTLAGFDLDAVDEGGRRDQAQRQGETRGQLFLRGVGADDLVADLEAIRCEDVVQGLVGVLDEGQVGGTVRIVLDPDDGRRSVETVATEIDGAVELLMTSATTTGGDAAVTVTAHRAVLEFGERALGATGVQALGLHAH